MRRTQSSAKAREVRHLKDTFTADSSVFFDEMSVSITFMTASLHDDVGKTVPHALKYLCQFARSKARSHFKHRFLDTINERKVALEGPAKRRLKLEHRAQRQPVAKIQDQLGLDPQPPLRTPAGGQMALKDITTKRKSQPLNTSAQIFWLRKRLLSMRTASYERKNRF
jgi:hypothetical protein